MNMATVDLYGTMDPFQRTSISPKRRATSNDVNNDDIPSDHQVNIFQMIFLFFRIFSSKNSHFNPWNLFLSSIT